MVAKKIPPSNNNRIEVLGTIGLLNPSQPSEHYVSDKENRVEFTCTEPIPMFSVLVTDFNGKVSLPDMDDRDLMYLANKIAVSTTTLHGQTVLAQLWGRIARQEWSWSTGAPIYVGVDGVLTNVIPNYEQARWSKIVAVADTPKIITMVNYPPFEINP